ncbi:MAG: hypothetical protein V1663_05790 [archaeon]
MGVSMENKWEFMKKSIWWISPKASYSSSGLSDMEKSDLDTSLDLAATTSKLDTLVFGVITPFIFSVNMTDNPLVIYDKNEGKYFISVVGINKEFTDLENKHKMIWPEDQLFMLDRELLYYTTAAGLIRSKLQVEFNINIFKLGHVGKMKCKVLDDVLRNNSAPEFSKCSEEKFDEHVISDLVASHIYAHKVQGYSIDDAVPTIVRALKLSP